MGEVLNYVDVRLKHRRIGALLGLEKEAVDNFCSVWWPLGGREADAEDAGAGWVHDTGSLESTDLTGLPL